MSIRNLLHEAMLDLRRRPWRSALLVGAVALTLAVVVVTAESGDAAARELEAALTTVEGRTITVRSKGEVTLPGTAVPPPGTSGIETVFSFGPISDVRLVGLPSRPPVALRSVAGPDLGPVAEGRGLATKVARDHLGLVDGVGGAVTTVDGVEYMVVPVDNLSTGLDPGQLWVPVGTVDRPTEIRVVVDDVMISPLVEALVMSLLEDVDPETVTIDRPSAKLRDYQLVADQAAERRFELTVGALVVVAVVTGMVVFVEVNARRRDFGRKRALGASRGTIVAMVVVQVGVLVIGGLAMGTLITAAAVQMVGGYWRLDGGRLLWLIVAMGHVASLTSLGPALVASSRDPLRELRLP